MDNALASRTGVRVPGVAPFLRVLGDTGLLFACTLAACLAFGYRAALAGAALGGLFIFAREVRKGDIGHGLLCFIVVLLPFDNKYFVFTGLNLRAWYSLLVLFWAFLAAKRALPSLATPRRASAWLLQATYVLCSLLFLLFDPMDGKLSNVKYAVFTVGLVLAYATRGTETMRANGSRRLGVLASTTLFVCVWGLLQTVAGVGALGERIGFDMYNVFPSAFFSETTWYGLFCLTGIIGTHCALRIGALPKAAYALMVPLVAGCFISVSRGVYLGFGAYAVIFVVAAFARERRMRRPMLIAAAGAVAILALLAVIFWEKVTPYVLEIVKKFTFNDGSGVGRFVAFEWSFRDLISVPLAGAGYSWLQYQVTTIGTFLGAKSFNVFFQLGHIFGVAGLGVFLLACSDYLARTAKKGFGGGSVMGRFSFAALVVFLLTATFTPVQQYPTGVLIAGLALWFGRVSSEEISPVGDV